MHGMVGGVRVKGCGCMKWMDKHVSNEKRRKGLLPSLPMLFAFFN